MRRRGAALRLVVLLTPAVIGLLCSGSPAAAKTAEGVPAVGLTGPGAHTLDLLSPLAQIPDVPADPIIEPPAAPAADSTDSPAKKPTAPRTPGSRADNIDVGGLTSNPIGIAVLLGALTLIPAALMTMTAFTRIVIVLGFTRSGLSTQSIPPNQVIIGLSLFLTFFVMAPTFADINSKAVQPYLHGEINAAQAYDRGIEPLRGFMLDQVRAKDLTLFTDMDNKPTPTSREEVPTTALIPAFVLSELHQAFIIGFVVFLPFLIIDLIVAAALSSLGMMMLPPVLVSLPFKLLLFVAVDGWYLVVGSLMRSFH